MRNTRDANASSYSKAMSMKARHRLSADCALPTRDKVVNGNLFNVRITRVSLVDEFEVLNAINE